MVQGLDPHYIERAKILTREEAETRVTRGFSASARKCRKIGEKAAKMRVSCVADTEFYDRMFNRVHNSKIEPSENDRALKELAYRISKCSVKFAKYFEKGCSFKNMYIGERKRCRTLPTRQARTQCKGEIRRRFHRTK